MLKLFSPLRRGAYRALWGSQLSSDMGNWFDFLALYAVIVYRLHSGAVGTAALAVSMALPWVVLGPLVAGRVKKLPAKSVLIVCDVIRALTALGFWVAGSLPALLVLAFVKNTAAAIFTPVHSATVRRVSDEADLPAVSALSQMSLNATKITAPAFGGLIIAGMGEHWCFIASMALFVGSAMMVSLLPRASFLNRSTNSRDTASNSPTDSSDATISNYSPASSDSPYMPNTPDSADAPPDPVRSTPSAVSGWRIILQHRLLRYMIAFSTALMFLIYLFDTLFAVWCESLGLPSAAFGWLAGTVGAGHIAGTLLMGSHQGWQRRPLATVTAASVVSGVVIASFALIDRVPLPPAVCLYPLALALGLSLAVSATTFGYVLQSAPDADDVGPVFACSQASQNGAMLLAPFLGALIAEAVGVSGVFLIAGGIMTVVSVTVCTFVRDGSSLPARTHIRHDGTTKMAAKQNLSQGELL